MSNPLHWEERPSSSRFVQSQLYAPGMLTLFHYPLCPHSRFVRLALEELGASPRLVEERAWERRGGFFPLNPAGPTPGAPVIIEYLEETRGDAAPAHLMPRPPVDRVEVRRLMSWFNDKFFAEAS